MNPDVSLPLVGASIFFHQEDRENVEHIEQILANNQIDASTACWPDNCQHATNRCDLVVWSNAALQDSGFVRFALALDSHDVMFQVCLDETAPPDPMRSFNCLQLPGNRLNAEYAEQLCGALRIIMSSGSHSKEPLFTVSTRVVRKMVAMNLAPAHQKAQPLQQKKRSFHLGEWLVEPTTNCLSLDNNNTRISNKAMDVLVLLAYGEGAVCSLDEILEGVWGKTIVGEDSVHRCISELRRSLNDSARHPTYIETIPKKGYRIISPIRWTA